MSILLKERKKILKGTFRLTLTTRKVVSKNLTRFTLSVTKKAANTIL